MDKRVYLLTIVSFVVGMVELIIGGILDLVATDLGVSLGQAGLLITIFSLVFAIAAPILLAATSNMERKRLMIIALFIFLFGNLIAVISPSYAMLLIARIISAASGSLLVVLCITMASNIVDAQYRARAIGIVFMGISGSLVLGVPIGVMLGNAFSWRAPFLLISILTVGSIIGVYFFLGKIAPKQPVTIREQLGTLKNKKILFAQLTTFLFLAGHLTLYGYLTPFLQSTMNLDSTWVSIVYLLFGVAAVTGGAIGGMFSDRFGAKRTILYVITVFGLSIFAIPYTTFALPLFLIVMIIWSMMSWAITPAMQSYLIQTSPETSDTQQSLNNSALHFGIAFGSLIGGVVIEQASVNYNATVGGFFVILALGAAIFSMYGALSWNRKIEKTRA
ncbi:DHA1 family purine base/nucleoside efflux pump-like MFS transporter [Virgibacillus natechei]|uniref:DHA1 family purine base/nucleoside efflux pump-like MFS transporter n=1 Tax=Virgibacillus natechei TaxID=1216297 RepID=A0ABS4IBU6_9BACI|nr:MFS transporter [Virgibacillus natechei]MBP1968412.1 DHA1 family purine base/nucleoside efflux pump-like MFS transporter [Virgibacillus natechei]UZD13535.1 MFS transporter [Virgibacillus natechei]